MKKELLINRASELRYKGYSLSEISGIVGISKSTASLWLRNCKIGKDGKKRLLKLKVEAIVENKNRKKREKDKYLSNISDNCLVFKKKKKYSTDVLKIFLALLFWGEGSKVDRRLIFINSDPKMIKTYLYLLRKSYSIDESKLRAVLHLHDYHNRKEHIEYWSKVTRIRQENITIYNKQNTGSRKKDDYKGCISIRYGDVKILDELFLIIKRFFNYINAGVV